MKKLSLFLISCLVLVSTGRIDSASAADLTPDQITSISNQIAELKKVIETQTAERSQSAWSVFKQASQDRRAAVDLYLKCYRLVNFEREGREEKDYDEWEDKQKERLRDENFLAGLMMQLHYLALTCQAAETEDFGNVLPALISHVESLTQLDELPAQTMLQGVGGSIFARAYQIEERIKSIPNWCDVPYDMSQIYESSILPFLREEKPEQLMTAWDRRIAHEMALMEFLEEQENRGNNRDERKKSGEAARKMQAGRTGQILKTHDKDDFERETLPKLQWGRMKDMYAYVDQVQGMTAMLSFVKANLAHERSADWLSQIASLLVSTPEDASAPEPEFESAPAVFVPPPVSSAPAVSEDVPVGPNSEIFDKFDQ